MSSALTLEHDAFQKLYPIEYYDKFLAEGVRPDGRVVQECRPPVVSPNAVGTADSSASVRLGNTFVLAGIKLELGVPAEGVEEQGSLTVQVVMGALGVRGSHISKVNDAAAALTHVLQQHLAGRHSIDLAQLCVVPAKRCWHVHLDVYVLNDDGGLLDACMCACTAALSGLRIPELKADEASGNLQPVEANGVAKTAPLQLKRQLLCLTAGMYRSHLICDLTQQEEQIAQMAVTIVTDGTGALMGVHASGGGVELPLATLHQAIKFAQRRHAEIGKLQGW